MIDLDAIVRDLRYGDYSHDEVILDAIDFFAMVDELNELRARIRVLTAPLPVEGTATKHASKPHLYRHRLDPNRVVRLLTYNLTTQKYHVEFYNGNSAPCHLNGYIDYAEMQMMYDLHNPIRDLASAESP
jgi:hypothetical protein